VRIEIRTSKESEARKNRSAGSAVIAGVVMVAAIADFLS